MNRTTAPSDPASTDDPTSRGRSLRLALAAGVLVLALVLGGVAWFLGGEAPQAVDITSATAQVTDTTQSTGDTDSTGETAPAEEDTPDGTWTVDPSIGEFSIAESTGTFVGVRIGEVLSNIGETTAVVRTPDVTGTITLDGTTLTTADLTADFTTLVSDESRREPHIQRALDTDTHPTATLTLTEPVDLGTLLTAAQPVEVNATGELTIAGTTRTVEVPLQVAIVDDVAVVTGAFEIAFADFGVQVPTAPVVVSVEDTGTVEVQLYLTQG